MALCKALPGEVVSSMTTKVQWGQLGPFRPCTVQQELFLLATNVPEGWPKGAWIDVTPEGKYIPVQRKSLCRCICLQYEMCEAPSLLHTLLQYLSSQQAITASSSRTVLQLRHQQFPLPQAISGIT